MPLEMSGGREWEAVGQTLEWKTVVEAGWLVVAGLMSETSPLQRVCLSNVLLDRENKRRGSGLESQSKDGPFGVGPGKHVDCAEG